MLHTGVDYGVLVEEVVDEIGRLLASEVHHVARVRVRCACNEGGKVARGGLAVHVLLVHVI